MKDNKRSTIGYYQDVKETEAAVFFFFFKEHKNGNN